MGGKGQASTSEFSTILRFLSSQPGSFFHLLKLLSKLGVRQGDSQKAFSTSPITLPTCTCPVILGSQPCGHLRCQDDTWGVGGLQITEVALKALSHTERDSLFCWAEWPA